MEYTNERTVMSAEIARKTIEMSAARASDRANRARDDRRMEEDLAGDFWKGSWFLRGLSRSASLS